MSHFTVGIITKGKPSEEKITEMLAPYQENNMSDCPEKFLEFNSTRAEYEEDYAKYTKTMYRDQYGNLYRGDEEQFKKEITKEEYDQRDGRSKCSSGWGSDAKYFVYERGAFEKVEIPYNVIWKTLEEFLENYHKEDFDEKAQDYGYWENPNSKWDWWEIGGRWAGMIKVPKCSESDSKENRGTPSLISIMSGRLDHYESREIGIEKVDSARIKDIIQVDLKQIEKLKRDWELIVEKSEPITEEEKETVKFSFYNPEYYKQKFGTKENYADLESRFTTYAVITKDGQWHESGKMGWFACSSATPEEEGAFKKAYKEFVFDKAEEDDWLTVVDCHI